LEKGRGKMPTIFFYGPELDKARKRELIRSFTESASKLTGINKSAFVVYLRASSPDNVGVGGELLRDRQNRDQAPGERRMGKPRGTPSRARTPTRRR